MDSARGTFWWFARRMLRRRWTAAGALVMAFISALGMGAGLLGLAPVLDNILGTGNQTLREQAAALSARLAVQAPGIFPDGLPREWIERLPTDRFDAVLIIIIALGVLTVFGAAANFLHAYLSLTLTTRAVADVRRAAFRRLLHLPLLIGISEGGDLTSRIISDTNMLSRGLQALTSKGIAQVTRGAVALVVALLVNWKLTLATLTVMPLLAVIIRKTGKQIRRASHGTMRSQSLLLADATEAVRAFRVVKAFGGERTELGRFTRDNKAVEREMLRLRTAQALASPMLETIAIFVLGGLSLIAAKAIIDGKLSPTEFLVCLGSLGMAGAALRPLSAVIQDIQTAAPAAARLAEVMRSEPEERRDPRRPRLGRHRSTIEFADVSFSYANAPCPAVDRVSLRIDHGEVVAFVGPNGSGKTTLLSMLPRLLLPSSGRILIDGVDIAGVNLRSLRRQIGVVTQETVLMRGTIASNIAYGTAGSTREQVERAARLAHAHNFITELSGGYIAVVGEGGLTLSGGQRQRVAIARALLRDPAILLMDEATSMIDAESESQIAEAIADMAGRRTVLIVAHRIATVMAAGRIVVMDRGRIVDEGRHDELVGRCRLYQEIWRGGFSG